MEDSVRANRLTFGAGAEFHESVFDLIPVDEEAAKVLHGSAFEQSFRYCLEAGRKIGRNFNAAKEFKKWLIETGFVEVEEKQYFSPVNGWPVDRNDQLIGHWCKYLVGSPFPSRVLRKESQYQLALPKFGYRIVPDTKQDTAQPAYLIINRLSESPSIFG